MTKKKIVKIFSIVIALISIFISTQIPVVKTEIKNISIAVVNNDKGELGKNIVSKIQENTGSNEAIKITVIDNKEKLLEEMKNENYYGALVIPENFSQSMATLSTNAENIPIDIIINQGKNTQVSAQVNQMLTNMANKLGDNIATQLITNFKEKNIPIPADLALKLKNPIKINTEIVNEVGDFKSGVLLFFQPIWMSSIIVATLLFMEYRKKEFSKIKEDINYKLKQITFIFCLALAIGFFTPLAVNWILGLDISNYLPISTFLSLASFSFIVLVSGIANLIGFPAFPIFGFLMFYGLPLLQLAPEMLPNFYTNWILPWLPMRFLFDGAKSILFFDGNLFNSSTNSLILIASIGIILIFIKYKTKSSK